MNNNKNIIFNRSIVYFSIYIFVCSLLLLLVLDLVYVFIIIGVPINLFNLFFLNKTIILGSKKIKFKYYLRPFFRTKEYAYNDIEALVIHLKQDSKNALSIRIKFKNSLFKKDIIFKDKSEVFKFLKSLAVHNVRPKIKFSKAASKVEKENIYSIIKDR